MGPSTRRQEEAERQGWIQTPPRGQVGPGLGAAPGRHGLGDGPPPSSCTGLGGPKGVSVPTSGTSVVIFKTTLDAS